MIRNHDLKQELSNMPEYFTIDELVGRLLVLKKKTTRQYSRKSIGENFCSRIGYGDGKVV